MKIEVEAEQRFRRFLETTGGDVAAAAMLVLASAIGFDPTGVYSEFLSVKRVAERLGVSEGTVRNLVASGKLPASRIGKGRGTLRFDPADLTRFQRESAGNFLPRSIR